MYYSITHVGALFYGKWHKLYWGGPRARAYLPKVLPKSALGSESIF